MTVNRSYNPSLKKQIPTCCVICLWLFVSEDIFSPFKKTSPLERQFSPINIPNKTLRTFKLQWMARISCVDIDKLTEGNKTVSRLCFSIFSIDNTFIKSPFPLIFNIDIPTADVALCSEIVSFHLDCASFSYVLNITIASLSNWTHRNLVVQGVS